MEGLDYLGTDIGESKPAVFAFNVAAITTGVVIAEVVILKVLKRWRWFK